MTLHGPALSTNLTHVVLPSRPPAPLPRSPLRPFALAQALLPRQGYTHSHVLPAPHLSHQHVPFMHDFAKDNPVSGSFFVGWMTALQKHQGAAGAGTSSTQASAQALFLDGAENYGFSNESEVLEMKRWLKCAVFPPKSCSSCCCCSSCSRA